MILNKEYLKYYLEEDRKTLLVTRKRPKIIGDH